MTNYFNDDDFKIKHEDLISNINKISKTCKIEGDEKGLFKSINISKYYVNGDIKKEVIMKNEKN